MPNQVQFRLPTMWTMLRVTGIFILYSRENDSVREYLEQGGTALTRDIEQAKQFGSVDEVRKFLPNAEVLDSHGNKV